MKTLTEKKKKIHPAEAQSILFVMKYILGHFALNSTGESQTVEVRNVFVTIYYIYARDIRQRK